MSNNSVIIPNDRVMIIFPLGVGVPYLCTQKLKKELKYEKDFVSDYALSCLFLDRLCTECTSD